MESFQVPTHIHSQSLSWIPVGSLANYIHAHKKTVSNNRFFHNLYIHTITALQIFVPSLLHTSLCFHGTLRCHKYICCGMLPWTSAGTYVCTYIHSRAFSVSCCSILWFLKYIDRMQRRRALVALHKGAQECCRHGSRHRSCKSSAARSYLSLRMPMPTALMPLADAITKGCPW